MNKRVALILAGGKAERFQTTNQPWQDKALAQIDGKPLLVKAVQNTLKEALETLGIDAVRTM